MFGSKLRSWMENHIVRPRKKGNKTKNGISNVANASAAGNSHDVHRKTNDAKGFTIYHGNGTTTTTTSITTGSVVFCGSGPNQNGCNSVISSPVRRREVSPIQNHTQSRYGWQSPDQEAIMSPKSDNFLYASQHQRVRASTPTSVKDTIVNSKSTSQQQPDCSSSSFSSLSWSTGSKEPLMQSIKNQKYSKTLPTVEILHSTQDDLLLSEMNCHHNDHTISDNRTGNNDIDFDDSSDVHYEEIKTLRRKPYIDAHSNNNNNNNNNFEMPRPKSDQFSSTCSPVRCFTKRNENSDDSEVRYGRLLPSKMQPQLSNPLDKLNGNHSSCGGSIDCIPSNNNHVLNSGTYKVRSSNVSNNAVVLSNNNKLRTVRYGSGTNAAASTSGNGVPMNSLSSPESAYSTGYSTDGTSPSAIYTPPEYYINMRTGTHYFPKSVNSLAIETQRYKFGLNKIEEMSPQDPLPNASFTNGASAALYHRADSRDAAKNKIPGFGIPDPEFCKNQIKLLEPQRPMQQKQQMAVGCHSPLSLRNTIVLPTLKGFESPSPRQRCRIRTNPWYSTTDTSSSGATIVTIGTTMTTQPFTGVPTTSSLKSSSSSTKKMELDAASSTSSLGVKSSSEADGMTKTNDKNIAHNGKPSYESESSSSLTEVENMQRTYTPNTVRRKRADMPVAEMPLYAQYVGEVVSVTATVNEGGAYQDVMLSDDDATLNEMMGKFDESYVYEKETDILSSDSDPTDCPSDLDTGQDAGDECDTDELLDIDFIDTSSIQELNERKDPQRNLGSCYYYSQHQSPTRLSKLQNFEARSSVRSRRNSRSQKSFQQHEATGSQSLVGGGGGGESQRRRKRFMKTRKKSSEGRGLSSPIRNSRESRSVGGTPVCLRRNQAINKERTYKTSPLSNRSSSLVFTDASYGKSRFVTIAESVKALHEADLEADVKYRQLIHEAESILVSMKNSVLSIPRDTPVASPRRVNPLANKRVEMLKNCEADVKRELLKQHQKQHSLDAATNAIHAEQDFVAHANKRIEQLKSETSSAPNSPKFSRLSPRKTHLTNFINQNVPPEVPLRKSSVPDTGLQPPQSPQLQLNGRKLKSPNSSPLTSRRRFRSQSPKFVNIFCETDSDTELSSKHLDSTSLQQRRSRDSLPKSSSENVTNRNYLPDIARIMLYDESDYKNSNVEKQQYGEIGSTATTLVPFNLVGGAMSNYCPQSEPLKRKVYKGSSSFERLKKSFDLESEIPKQALLEKINQLRRERHNSTTKLSVSAKSSSHDLSHSIYINDDDSSVASSLSFKKQLLLSTIEDLKRSLENQSVELHGLNKD